MIVFSFAHLNLNDGIHSWQTTSVYVGPFCLRLLRGQANIVTEGNDLVVPFLVEATGKAC